MAALRNELELKGFTFTEDDHTLTLEYKGQTVATFGNRVKPEMIQLTADLFLRNLDVRMG